MTEIQNLKDNLFKYKKKQIAAIFVTEPLFKGEAREIEIRKCARIHTLKELRIKLADHVESLEWEVDMEKNGRTKAYQKRAYKRLQGHLSPHWKAIHSRIRMS